MNVTSLPHVVLVLTDQQSVWTLSSYHRALGTHHASYADFPSSGCETRARGFRRRWAVRGTLCSLRRCRRFALRAHLRRVRGRVWRRAACAVRAADPERDADVRARRRAAEVRAELRRVRVG